MGLGAHNPYAVLGVTRSATQEEIKAAFRRLALRHHPDINTSDPAARTRFTQINEAYEVLGDEGRRRAFDRESPWGSTPPRADAAPNDGHKAKPAAHTTGMGAFEEFLRTMNPHSDAPPPPNDSAPQHDRTVPKSSVSASAAVQLFFMEAAKGCTKEVEYTVVTTVQGLWESTRHVGVVHFPPGTQSGQTLRMDTERGPCFIRVFVEEHEVFVRLGSDLHSVHPLTLTQAVFGATVLVPGLDGEVTIVVPSGTQHGDVHRLPEGGLPDLHSPRRGDHVVHFVVEIPTTLTLRQRSLLEAFRADEGAEGPPRPPDPSRLRRLTRRWRHLFAGA